jgi:hypothetical protein
LGNLPAIRRLIALLAALALICPAVHPAERVSLRNGFAIRCDHHAAVAGHVRLYLGAGEDNYIEFPPDEIACMETVADPPPASRSEQSQLDPSAAARATSKLDARPEAKLSPSDLHEMLAEASQEHNLDVDLLASLVKAESGGNVHARSRAGAQGLMQLMPATAKRLGVEDSFQPEENVRGGSSYLDGLLARYHNNLALALAAYNAGPEAVEKYHGIPPYRETRTYVARVIHEFNRRVLAHDAEARRAAAEQVRQAMASSPARQ